MMGDVVVNMGHTLVIKLMPVLGLQNGLIKVFLSRGLLQVRGVMFSSL